MIESYPIGTTSPASGGPGNARGCLQHLGGVRACGETRLVVTSNSQTHVGTTAAPGAAGELQRALEYARANGAPEGVVDEANAVVAILSELRLDPDVLTAAALYAALRDHGSTFLA